MEKMLRETHLKYPHALRILLLIAVAAGALWMGAQEAEACYNYNGSYPWYVAYYCWNTPSCDDVGGYPCWEETCAKNCVNGSAQGALYYQNYGCDTNCGQIEYCADC